MTYAVYVAKNKKEYSWYSENDFKPQENCPDGYLIKKKIFSPEFVSFVVVMDSEKDALIKSVRQNNGQEECSKVYVGKLLELLGCKSNSLKQIEINVFTHWGDGNSPETVSEEEKLISQSIEECKVKIRLKEDYSVIEFKQRSLSSLRSEALAVGEPRIKVPDTIEKMLCLIYDLENIADKKRDIIIQSAQQRLDARLATLKMENRERSNKTIVLIDEYNQTDACQLLKKALESGVSKELNIDLTVKMLGEVNLLQRNIETLPIWIAPSIIRLRKHGFSVPREFVVETLRPYLSKQDQESGKTEQDADIESPFLVDRLKQLIWQFEEELKISSNTKLTLKDRLRDWSIGAFRKYCFLDENVHGTSGCLDLYGNDCVKIKAQWLSSKKWGLDPYCELDSDITEEIAKVEYGVECHDSDPNKLKEVCAEKWEKVNTNRRIFRKRFGHGDNQDKEPTRDPLEHLQTFFEKVFEREYDNIRQLIQAANEDSFRNRQVKAVFSEFDVLQPTKNRKASIPKGCGFAIRHTSPTLKFNVLVIDDNANDECNRLKKLKSLYGIFDFEPMELKGDVILKKAEEKFKNTNVAQRTYDFALLDLSLGEDPGSDLYGYQLIQLLHQFFPQMPVIVYSQFSDMGHIARAFRYGAKWFLKKDEAYKLLRHAISILSLRDWRKEWNTVNRLGLCGKIDVRGPKDFTEEQKYLTYRCMEKLPGKDIFVKVMGDGFSSAVTFRARKWSEDKQDKSEADKKGARVYLQDPVIIKIDTAFNTMTEYERYFRFIRPYIANESGRVEAKEITLDHNNSAITYTFAGKNDSSRMLDTMKNMLGEDVCYMARCDYKKYEAVFDEIFDDILPKIHRVSPKEPNLESPISSYPNRIFGEKETEGIGFIDNYLARMPLSRQFNVKKFVDPGTSGSVPFEMHGVSSKGGKKVIEAYALKPYSKLNVILTGDAVNHVARYRELKQGQTLWVDGDYVTESTEQDGKKQDVVKTEMDSVILERLKEILYSEDCKDKDKNGNPTFYDGETDRSFKLSAARTERESESRQLFTDLFKVFVLGRKPEKGEMTDVDFRAMVNKKYQELRELSENAVAGERFKCKVGIVHGDLNYANIMVDSKKDGTIEDAKDVWLIDFARTRRDIIAHDFNVIFTATFSQLFNNDLWNDKGIDDNDATRYAARLTKIFPRLIKDAMFAESDEEPDYLYVMEDRRFTLFYKIFRRIRKAALSNGNMTEDMYALTTALCCLYTFKVFLKYEKNIQGAAALLATAHICIEHLQSAKS